MNWFWVWGSVRTNWKLPWGAFVFGAGYHPFRSVNWARREKRDDGMVLFGKG